MSVFVVDMEHIHLLVRLALSGPRDGEHRPGDGGFPLSYVVRAEGQRERARLLPPGAPKDSAGDLAPDELGALWFAHNVRSVMREYPDTIETGELPGCGDEWRRPYHYLEPGFQLSCAEAIKAIACLNEQCASDPDWRLSAGRQVLYTLQERVACVIPGVTEALFCWTSADVDRALAANR